MLQSFPESIHHTSFKALSIVILCNLKVFECTSGPHILYCMAEDLTNILTAIMKAACFVLY